MRRFLNTWQIAPALFVFGLMVGPAERHANADDWNKRTVLTVNQPIEIADNVLQPGKYVVQLVTPNTNQHVVQIFNSDHTHLIGTVLTYPAQRLEPTGKTKFTYWETPAGTMSALKDWYYPGDNFGEEFPYPKNPRQIAMATSAPQPAPPAAPEPAPAPVASTPAPAEPSAPPEPPAAQPVQPEPEQAAPPASATDQNPQPPAASATQGAANRESTELPKTGSPYPAFGIAGVFFLGLAGLLRLRQPVKQS